MTLKGNRNQINNQSLLMHKLRAKYLHMTAHKIQATDCEQQLELQR